MAGDFLPVLVMVIVQMGYAGMNIFSKLAMDSGMNPFVHVAYRQIFATISLIPFAYFFERKTRPRMTFSILFQIFLCSIFGVTLNQITFFVGLKNSTPTIACALSNLSPAITFLLAIPLGLESVGIRSKGGLGKVFGTVVCVGGAILLSFYHGPQLGIGQSSIHWKLAENNNNGGSSNNHDVISFILGPFLLIASSISWAVWLIIQARVGKQYAAPYSSSAIMCLMASIECVIIAICINHKLSAWSMNPRIRFISSLYSGIMCSAMAFCLMSWCISRKGPLYVSVFSPLLLIMVAILSWALLQEKLYTGTLVGSILIVMGLYGVLWGKKQEMEPSRSVELQNQIMMINNSAITNEAMEIDIEQQLYVTNYANVVQDKDYSSTLQ